MPVLPALIGEYHDTAMRAASRRDRDANYRHGDTTKNNSKKKFKIQWLQPIAKVYFTSMF
jgi:hypothetical protein